MGPESQDVLPESHYKSKYYITQLLSKDKADRQVLDIILFFGPIGADAPSMSGAKSLHSLHAQDTLHIAQEKWP